MNVYQKYLSCFVVGTSLILSTYTAHADRHSRTYYSSECLSWYEIYKVTRQALPEIQAVDPDISMRDLFISIVSSARCVTTETASEVIAGYTEKLEEDVQAINNPPQISGTPIITGTEGTLYSFTPLANDADGDTLKFQITNQPSWASFNASTGTLSGTPSYTDAGSYSNIVISVNDGQASASLSAFSISISDTNRSPSISGTPNINVLENTLYSFIPSASDADGDKLTFNVSGLPEWASFDPSNGTLSGVPDYQDAGSYNNISISVTDGKSTASLTPFTIVVENLNRLPTIGGDPDINITVGELYSFTPYATDLDNDNLVFSISNPPEWIEFDNLTGALIGTPETTDIGIYENITISVSDGSGTEVSMVISITVDGMAETMGTATLSWEIPTSRSDGTPLALSEIEGYRLYIGPSQDNLSIFMDLNDGSITNYTVNNLPIGNHYFSVTTYDTDGNESPYSNIAMKEIL